MVQSFLAAFAANLLTGVFSLLNVSWLMFNSENDFIKEPRRRSGKPRSMISFA